MTFLKGYDAGFPKKSKFSINSCFAKNFSGGSLCTRSAAGIWAVDLFSTTYFGEIIIFVVSKDQTFRIRCTLMNPEQFLILVPYLIRNDFILKTSFLSENSGFLSFFENSRSSQWFSSVFVIKWPKTWIFLAILPI